GWAGSWELRSMSMGWGFPGKGGPERGPQRSALNIESGLGRGDAVVSGGMLEASDSVTYRRMLANPIRLDADGVYYLSFLLRRERYDERSSLSLTLRQTKD